MSSKKKILIVLSLLIISVIFLSGCKEILEYQQKYYDDDEMIAKQEDNYSSVKNSSHTNVFNGKAEFNMDVKKFDGKLSLLSLETDTAKEVSMALDFELESGKFKICLITPLDEVVVVADESNNDTLVLNIESGKSQLVMVGVDAKYQLKINIEKHEGVSLKSLFS